MILWYLISIEFYICIPVKSIARQKTNLKFQIDGGDPHTIGWLVCEFRVHALTFGIFQAQTDRQQEPGLLPAVFDKSDGLFSHHIHIVYLKQTNTEYSILQNQAAWFIIRWGPCTYIYSMENRKE